MRAADRKRFVDILSVTSFLVLFSSLILGCGGSSSSATSTTSGTTTPTSPTTTSNVLQISVTTGPAGDDAIDEAFTSVTICAPGSTTQCQTISGILVDTGSSGLRVLSSALTISLPQQDDSSGNPIGECNQFVDSETWGPVQKADITLAGEKASSVPVQVIGSPSFAAVPASCANLGTVTDDLVSLGANGVLGVGNFIQDCGPACEVSGSENAGFYYSCPASGCAVEALSAAQQVSNPVYFFATDNNGVIVELPAVSGTAISITGSLIFGIGTQSNNGLGNATVVYTIDPNVGNFTTTFGGQTYTDAAYLDTGSNSIFFLDSTATGMPLCSLYNYWYCPSTAQNFSAVNKGTNGAMGTINFTISNAETLTSNASDGVAVNLGGPYQGGGGDFDWGLPFFFGRNIYTAIEGQSTPGGAGPYWAY